MGVDLERGPLTSLDNKLAEDAGLAITDSNKMSRSIAEKTAKLHRLLGDSDKEKGFHLGNKTTALSADCLSILPSADLESPESEKLTDSVSEKEEKDVDELDEDEQEKRQLAVSPQPRQTSEPNTPPVRRRHKKKEELPPGWERHEVGRSQGRSGGAGLMAKVNYDEH